MIKTNQTNKVTYVLLVTGTVKVLVGFRGEQIHVRNDREDAPLFFIKRGLSACNQSGGKGGYGSNRAQDKGGGGLHDEIDG